MELWDAYNEKLEKIGGVTLVRGEAIPEGCFHLVGEVIVRHLDGTWLLMQRDHKKHMGGMWEATAGGSALQGEDPTACAKRELWEETGILSDSMEALGYVIHFRHRTIYAVYLCLTGIEKDGIRLQEGETAGYRWIPGSELKRMGPDELASRRTLDLVPELC